MSAGHKSAYIATIFVLLIVSVAPILAEPSRIETICGVKGQPVWVKNERDAMFMADRGDLTAEVFFGTELLKTDPTDHQGYSRVVLYGWFDNFFSHPAQQGRKALTIKRQGGDLQAGPKRGSKHAKRARISGKGLLSYLRQADRFYETCLVGQIASSALTDNPNHVDLHGPETANPALKQTIANRCALKGVPVTVSNADKAVFTSRGTSVKLNYGAPLRVLEQSADGTTSVLLQGWLKVHSPKFRDKHTLTAPFGSDISSTPEQWAKAIAEIRDGSEVHFAEARGDRFFRVCLTGKVPSAALSDSAGPHKPEVEHASLGECHPQAKPVWMSSRHNNQLRHANGKPLAEIGFGTRMRLLDPAPKDGRLHVALTGWTDPFGIEQIDRNTIRSAFAGTHLQSNAGDVFSRIAKLPKQSHYPFIGRQWLKGEKASHQLCIEGFIPVDSVTDSVEKIAALAEEHAERKYEQRIAAFAPVSGELKGARVSPVVFSRILYTERDSYEKSIGLGILTGGLSVLPHINKINRKRLRSQALPLITQEGHHHLLAMKEIDRVEFSRCRQKDNRSATCGMVHLRNGKILQGRIGAQKGARVSQLELVSDSRKITRQKLPCDCALTFGP